MAEITLIHGDCLDVLKDLPTAGAVITDPPYGVSGDTDYTRFSGGISPKRNKHKAITNDEKPFDPAPWLGFKHVCLWGANFYCDKLPAPGTWLVWLKKRDNQIGTFLSDCELAWMKGGKGVYLFKHVWHGFDRESERGKTLHPTQKPVALFRWVIEQMRLPRGTTIIDPYMGSGPCGVAAVELGFDFIGCEIERGYFNIAKSRLKVETVD